MRKKKTHMISYEAILQHAQKLRYDQCCSRAPEPDSAARPRREQLTFRRECNGIEPIRMCFKSLSPSTCIAVLGTSPFLPFKDPGMHLPLERYSDSAHFWCKEKRRAIYLKSCLCND